MQVIGIDFDDKNIRGGRIQNIEKPEFVKLKQFQASNKGLKQLDAWIDECCGGDHASVLISLIVEDQQGASLAYRFNKSGFDVAPMTYAGIAREIREDKLGRQTVEIIAQKAINWKMRWMPLSSNCLKIRALLLERETARIGYLENQAKADAYSEQNFDFLIQLTQNAANAQLQQMQNAEAALISSMKSMPEFQKNFELLMTIPGMSEIGAACLNYVMVAYPSETAENLVGMLKLHNAARIKSENYRCFELRIVRRELFELAAESQNAVKQTRDLVDRLIETDKSTTSITMASAHKIARIAWAMVKKQQAYQA